MTREGGLRGAEEEEEEEELGDGTDQKAKSSALVG